MIKYPLSAGFSEIWLVDRVSCVIERIIHCALLKEMNGRKKRTPSITGGLPQRQVEKHLTLFQLCVCVPNY